MNLCIVTMSGLASQPSGSPKVVTQKARALAGLGHRVLVVTDDPRSYYEVMDGAFVPRPFPRWSLLLHRTIRRYAGRRLSGHGLPVLEQPQFHCAFDPGMALRVLFCASKESVDLLHAEKLGYAYPCLPARLLLGIFTVLVEHDVEYQRLADTCDLTPRAHRFMRRFERNACGRVDAVVTVSGEDRRRLTRLGVEGGKIHVIPHGVDTAQFARGRRERVRGMLGLEGAVVGIFHGTGSYKPNRDAIVSLVGEVLPAISGRGLDLKLLILGGPPPGVASPAVISPGVVEEGVLADYLAAADIALLPIRSGGGTRLKILEYFAAGVPVVSTAKGAEGLGAEDGKHLLLAETAEEMAGAALRLAGDPALRARIIRNALEFARGRDWRLIAMRYLELYSRGIRRAGRRWGRA